MSKLPEKAVLDGSKIPKTTTGEMKEALGELHDYLKELLGEDSGDKESARLALGIDLEELSGNIDAKADRSELSSVAMTGSYDDLKDKPDLSERGVPIGTVAWFAMPVPPAGYLKCDGAAVGRETCPELFAAIGTTFGAGDGETTFNLPDLIGRFAEGSATPGTVKEAGLPNITGDFATGSVTKNNSDGTVGNEQLALGGCFEPISAISVTGVNETPSGGWFMNARVGINASRSNITYGKSDTVQPPALTLLPCIKAFDAAIDSGLIDITELANEVAGKADKTEVANLAMPSNSRVDLTFPPNGTTDYVAPADGYFCLSCDASNGFIQILNPNNGLITGYSFGQSEVCRLYLPARKDIGIQVTVSATINNQYGFYFIYANGSQPV